MRFIGFYFTPRELWVVMEYMDAGALTDVVLHTMMSEKQGRLITIDQKRF